MLVSRISLYGCQPAVLNLSLIQIMNLMVIRFFNIKWLQKGYAKITIPLCSVFLPSWLR